MLRFDNSHLCYEVLDTYNYKVVFILLKKILLKHIFDHPSLLEKLLLTNKGKFDMFDRTSSFIYYCSI